MRRMAAIPLHNRRGRQRFRFSTAVTVMGRTNAVPAKTVDVSDTGARLRLERAVLVHSDCLLSVGDFDLVVPSVVVWRRGLDLGIRFLGGDATAAQVVGEPPSFGRRRPRATHAADGRDPGPA